jgi:hypothetical protein
MKCSKIGVLSMGILLLAQFGQAQVVIIPNPRLTWNVGDSECPAIAVEPSDNIHIVWYDDTPGNYEIFYKKSTDKGITWSKSQRLTWTLTDSWSPCIAVDSAGNPYVVWHEYMSGNAEVYFKKSTDGGATWTMNKRVTWNAGWSIAPKIAVDSSGGLHLVWSDFSPGNYEVFYARSTNGGATWSTGKRLTWNAGWSLNPRIAVCGSKNLYVVWSDSTPGVNEIYYARSMDGGATWTTAKRLTWNAGWSYGPDIAVDLSGNPHVVWYDDTPGNQELYYIRSADGGASWSAGKRLTWNASGSWNPAIAIGLSGRIDVVCEDNALGNDEIFYKGSADGGATWSSNIRFSRTSGESAFPDIGVDSWGRIYVVWHDDTPGNNEIYYIIWEFMVPFGSFFSR